MPPKGCRRTARKSVLPPKKLPTTAAESPSPSPNPLTQITPKPHLHLVDHNTNSTAPDSENQITAKPEFVGENTLPQSQPDTKPETQITSKPELVEDNTHTLPESQDAETQITAKPELVEVTPITLTQPDSNAIAQDAETQITAKPDFVEENTNATEIIASAQQVVVTVDDGKCIDSGGGGGGGNAIGGKPKKVVKKTIKVVRKIIKKVPKKVVKPQLDEFIKPAADQSVPVTVTHDLKPEENRSSEGMKIEENDVGLEQVGAGHIELKAIEQVDKNVNNDCEGKLFSGELEALERRKKRKTEVFVGGLGKDATEDHVRNVFAQVGQIVDLRVVTSSKTGNKFAFLRYANAEDAKKALDTFAKVKICGKECAATPVEGNDTIYLGNINKNWKHEDVLKLLNGIGIDKIDNVNVMINPNNSNCNRGFAFIEFETIRDAQVAYSKLQEKDVFGKNLKLKVAWADPLKELDEEEMLKVKTVYAEFIPASWDEEKVRDTFKKFGEIDDIVLARNKQTSKRKDFAFISYHTREAAIKCIELFGHELGDGDGDGTKVNVKVSLAKPISKGKVKQTAKHVAKEGPRAFSKPSLSKLRPSEIRNRMHESVSRYGIHNSVMSSTNVELVRLLREQASRRPLHGSLSNSPMDIHYNTLSGRKRRFPLLEPALLSGELNRYPRSHLDDRYSVASSSHNVLPPSDLTNSRAHLRQHSGYPIGSHYGARNYANNIEMRDRERESNFLHWRY